jgi:hypothetical protein
VKHNVTHSSSTFAMMERYIRIRAENKKVGVVEEMVPTGHKEAEEWSHSGKVDQTCAAHPANFERCRDEARRMNAFIVQGV